MHKVDKYNYTSRNEIKWESFTLSQDKLFRLEEVIVQVLVIS